MRSRIAGCKPDFHGLRTGDRAATSLWATLRRYPSPIEHDRLPRQLLDVGSLRAGGDSFRILDEATTEGRGSWRPLGPHGSYSFACFAVERFNRKVSCKWDKIFRHPAPATIAPFGCGMGSRAGCTFRSQEERNEEVPMFKKSVTLVLLATVATAVAWAVPAALGQDAKTILSNASKAMGADNLKTVQYSGTATEFAFGQAATPWRLVSKTRSWESTRRYRLPPHPPAHKAFAARSPASAPRATATKS